MPKETKISSKILKRSFLRAASHAVQTDHTAGSGGGLLARLLAIEAELGIDSPEQKEAQAIATTLQNEADAAAALAAEKAKADAEKAAEAN